MEYPAVRLAAWAEKDAQRDAFSRVQIHRAMGIRTELSLGEVGAWTDCRFELARELPLSMYDEELRELVERIIAATQGEGVVVADGCATGTNDYCQCIGYFGSEIRMTYFAREISAYDAASAWLESCGTSELNRRYAAHFATDTAGGRSRSVMMDALADRIDQAMQEEGEASEARCEVETVRKWMKHSRSRTQERLEVSVTDLGAWIRFAGFRLNSREQRRVRRMQRLEGAQKESI